MDVRCEHDGECVERHYSIPISELSQRVALHMEAPEVMQTLKDCSRALSGDLKTRVDALLSRVERPAMTQAQIEAGVADWLAKAEAEADEEVRLLAGLRGCDTLKDCWCDTLDAPGTADHNQGGA